jgi:hypothetical protein
MTTIRTLLTVATATIVTAGMSRQPLGDEAKTSVSFRTFAQIPERAARLIPATDKLSEEYA